MYGDYRLIPPGPECDGCPYWEIVVPMGPNESVPTTRCRYLDIVGNSCVDDSVKVCEVDLPRDQYIGPPLAYEQARLISDCSGLVADTVVLVISALEENRLWVFDGRQEVEVLTAALVLSGHVRVSFEDYVAWLVKHGREPVWPRWES